MKVYLPRILFVSCLLLPLKSFAQTNGLITAFTNPIPSSFADFGWSVAALGSDRVIIGARSDDTGTGNSGAAYLMSTNGTVLMTFTNPIPRPGASFGEAVAAVGTDRLVIGALPEQGAAYLFATNGTLLTTFTNPHPASILWFGSSLAVIGGDRVLIGAPGYDTGMTNGGAAFLFSTNGVLLSTLTNPHPGNHLFARSLAIVLGDKLLVGAPWDNTSAVQSGAAFLFSTNGALLTILTHPTPAGVELFGHSLAPMGNDRILVGAPVDDLGAENTGAAYLLSSNGTVLASFTSPNPTPNGSFGASVAAVGNDRILVGASSDDNWTHAGAAYLFNTNGHLLASFTNPTTSQFSNQYLAFGYILTALGSDTFLIGSPYDKTGAENSGAAYLFTIPPPPLQIRLTSMNTIAVSWPSPRSEFALQENTSDLAAPHWSDVTGNIQDDGTNVTFIVTPPTGNRFYRLLKP